MTTELQVTALALRDLAEMVDATRASLKLEGGTLTWSERGLWLAPDGGEPVDLTEWVDYVGFVPVDVVVPA